jgi:hypothetical protein
VAEPATSVRLVGFAELGAALAASPRTFDDAYVAARRSVAAVLVTAAQGRAPSRTGTLRGTISPDTSQGVGGLTWGTDYGGVIHWGWPDHNIAANRFATQGASATESRWLDVIDAANESALSVIAASAP